MPDPDAPPKPDAKYEDNVLELLNAPVSESERSGTRRRLSQNTRENMNAENAQVRFRANQVALQQFLATLERHLDKLRQLNFKTSIQFPKNLQVLTVDVKLGASSVSPQSADLIEQRLLQILKHIKRLGVRLSDSRSRVLITGDLNAGKSSLCNRLLKRSVLPVDQQPCTDVFCEVIDYSKNSFVEEVHAIPHSNFNGVNPLDETKLPVLKFPLEKLGELVHKSDEYRLLLVFVKDPRPSANSLLNNGVVDICLIDAPGLNVSEVTTTELFGRQEEIDLVIFVVNAENHFTQSAKEFVSDTAREKSLLFIAVNNYNKIKDKERCRTNVLNQVHDLAPETYKGADDFVHFGNYNGDPDDPDFDNLNDNSVDDLERALRTFILEKRSASKLSPAKTYIQNVLNDLHILSKINRENAEHEVKELSAKLEELMPEIDSSIGEYAKVSDTIEKDTEKLVSRLLKETEDKLNFVVGTIGEEPVIEWKGLMSTFEYANKTREALVQNVLNAVDECEEDAREITANAVSAIKQLGILHVGEQPAFSKVFNKSAMFSRKKDNLSRKIMAEFNFTDMLFDFSSIIDRPLPVLESSKAALLSSQTSSLTFTAISLAASLAPLSGILTPLAPVISIANKFDLKKLYLPALALASISFVAYAVYELPNTIPKRLARKIAFELDEMGYVRANAERIASESRKVLHYPAQDVRSAFQSQLESRTRKQKEFEHGLEEAEFMLKVLAEIEEDSSADNVKIRRMVL